MHSKIVVEVKNTHISGALTANLISAALETRTVVHCNTLNTTMQSRAVESAAGTQATTTAGWAKTFTLFYYELNTRILVKGPVLVLEP